MIETNNIADLNDLFIGKRALIFDLDGTIANTEKLHWEAYNECLAEYNVYLSPKDINKYIGNTEIKIYEEIKKDFKIEYDNKEFYEKRISIFFELVKNHKLKPYKYFLDICKKYSNLEFFVLSSQKSEVIYRLFKIWNIDSKFSKIISVADCEFDKKTVLKNLNDYYTVNANECILFEDGNKTLEFAQQLGILSIGIMNEYNLNQLKNCDVIIKCLDI